MEEVWSRGLQITMARRGGTAKRVEGGEGGVSSCGDRCARRGETAGGGEVPTHQVEDDRLASAASDLVVGPRRRELDLDPPLVVPSELGLARADRGPLGRPPSASSLLLLLLRVLAGGGCLGDEPREDLKGVSTSAGEVSVPDSVLGCCGESGTGEPSVIGRDEAAKRGRGGSPSSAPLQERVARERADGGRTVDLIWQGGGQAEKDDDEDEGRQGVWRWARHGGWW